MASEDDLKRYSDSEYRDSLIAGGGDLFFQIGRSTEDEELEELAELQKGRDYQATYIVSESAGKFREIVMTISLTGVKVTEPSNKKRSREFQIEQIVQYSYNRSQQRFNFAYLEGDGALTNYRFMSKDYFDIHQTLGNAINLMVKVKNNEFTPEMLERAAQGKFKSMDTESIANSVFSLATQGDFHQNGMHRQSSMESLGGNSMMSKASLTKYYMENKYKNLEKPEFKLGDAPPIVVHGGDDDNEGGEGLDDAVSVNTNDPEHLEGEEGDQISSDLKKNSKSKGTGTVRGWTLFGTQRSPKGLKKAELGSIDEKDLAVSDGRLNVPDGTMGKGLVFCIIKYRRGGLDKRRKSIQDVFKGGQTDEDKDANKSGSLANSVSVLSEGNASANSIDTINNKSDKDIPPVVKKFDQYGREILIKNARGGKYDITAGTIEALVEALAEEAPPDTIYIEVFLLTFRHFMSSVQLLNLLKQRFMLKSDNPQTDSIIRVRVISVLKKWAERHYYDFRFPDAQQAFQGLLDEINKTECAKYGAQIKNILDAEQERAKTFVPPEKPITPPEIQKVLDSVDLHHYWTPKKIAQELTLVDIRLFRQIKPDEFCIFLWGEKNDTKICNFNAYISRFNKLGFWVSTVVCLQKDIKKRAELIEKFIQILKYLQKYQNYSTLMAIHSGLNTTAVSRLKKTWEIVNKGRYISIYKDIEAKMSYRSNFKAYREIEAMAKAPFIPFFGLYVKDLTFMNDGNQKHVVLPTRTIGPSVDPNAPPLTSVINFEKCRSITDKIHAIRVFQQSTYRFEEEKDDKQDGFFSNFVSVTGTDEELSVYFGPPFGPPAVEDEKKLLEMSRECEPSEKSSSNYTVGPASGKSIAQTHTNSSESTNLHENEVTSKKRPSSVHAK